MSSRSSAAAVQDSTTTALALLWHREVTVDSEPALVALSMDEEDRRDDDDDDSHHEDPAEHHDPKGGGAAAVLLLLCQVATAHDFFTGHITVRELKNIVEPQAEPPPQQQQDAADGRLAEYYDCDEDLRQSMLALPIPVPRFLQLLETACGGGSASTPASSQQGEPPPLTLGFVKTTTTTATTTTTTTDSTETQDKNAVLLRVFLKQRMPSGIVRTLFQTTLTRVSSDDDDDAPPPQGSHLLQLALRLRQRHTALLRQWQTWQQRCADLQQAKQEWQATAEQLEGQWDQEKTRLLRNFCDLYTAQQNDSRQRCRDMEQQIQTLQRELERTRSSRRGGGTATRLPESLLNVPGDADQELLFDPELVRCLAEGRRVATAAANAPRPTSHPPQPSMKRKRRNPTLGTMEYWDVEAALEDVEEDEEEDDAARKPAAPPAAKNAKSKAPPPSNHHHHNNDPEDDSSTASDSSLFDAKMHGDIMSQLAKL